jgi:thiol:disulfide interchange protein DsbA
MMKKLILGLIVGLVCVYAPAQAKPQYTEGQQYIELFQPQPVDTGDKIEVRELFWYGCPHCYALEPFLEKWLKHKPANVEFIRMPAVLRESWAPLARAYYTFKVLGVADKLNGAVFRAIHEEHQDLNNLDTLTAFAVKHGIERKAFLDAYNSFAVNADLRRSEVVGKRYGADGVPTIIVDGRYRVTAGMAGGHEDMLRVVDFLIKKAEADRKRAAAAH